MAVCARSIVSARAFAEKLGIERSYDDVQRLADDADVGEHVTIDRHLDLKKPEIEW